MAAFTVSFNFGLSHSLTPFSFIGVNCAQMMNQTGTVSFIATLTLVLRSLVSFIRYWRLVVACIRLLGKSVVFFV